MVFLQLLAVCVVASQFVHAGVLITARNFPSSPAFSGCGKQLPKGQSIGGVTNVTISSDGDNRSYLVFIPPEYNAFSLTPLILSYHGGSRNSSSQLLLDKLTSPEFNTESIVVYPQGIDVRFNLDEEIFKR
jgi:poly(3-hydroxybutyrate) depolymerase